MSLIIRKPRFTSQTGDTIVEVMIVLAVLGLAIAISYATANRSLLNTRQAQENSQATELVQSQIEALRVLAPTSTPANIDPGSNVFLPTTPYCIHSVTATPPLDNTCGNFGSIPYTILIYNHATCLATMPTVCQGVNDAHTLIAQATWPDVLGQGTDSVTLVYKAYPLP